jgi:hypothetical protein
MLALFAFGMASAMVVVMVAAFVGAMMIVVAIFLEGFLFAGLLGPLRLFDVDKLAFEGSAFEGIDDEIRKDLRHFEEGEGAFEIEIGEDLEEYGIFFQHKA